jgi:hypothetical protein
MLVKSDKIYISLALDIVYVLISLLKLIVYVIGSCSND